MNDLRKIPFTYVIFITALILTVIFLLFNIRSGELIMGLISAGSFLYIIFSKQNDTEILLSSNVFKIAFLTFIFTYILSIDVLFYSLERNLFYFILVSIAATSLFVQIFTEKSKSLYVLILFEIIILAINTNSSVFIYPVYNGYGDIIFHQFATQTVYQTAHILGFSSYSMFPLTSTLAGITKIITNIPIFYSWVIPISVSYLLSIIFTFYIGFYLKGNYRFGLLCALLLASFQPFILWGSQLAPTSFCFGIFTFIIYIIIKNDNRMQWSLILILIAFLMILSHNLITFITLVLLSLWYLYDKINTNQNVKSPYSTYTILFIVSALFYWIYSSYSNFFELFISNIKNLLFNDLISVTLSPHNLSIYTSDIIISFMADSILILFSLIILLRIIDKRNYKIIFNNHWMKIVIGLSIFIIYGLTIFVPFLGAFPSERLDLYGTYFLIFITASGIFYLSKKGKLTLSLILCILLIFSFSSNINTAYESEPLKINKIGTPSSVFKNSDVYMGIFIKENIKSTISTDLIYSYYLKYKLGINSYYPYNLNREYPDKIIIRKNELETRGLKFSLPSGSNAEYLMLRNDFSRFDSYNQIYDDNDIILSR